MGCDPCPRRHFKELVLHPQPADLVLEILTATPPADLLWTRLETTVNGTHVIDLGNRVPVFQPEEVARRQPQL